MNKNRKDYSLVIFFILILIFTVICFILKFGDVNMNSEKIKNGIFLGICFIVAVPIIYFVFVDDKYENSYSNTLEVSDSGITLVYTGDARKAKICLIKYIDESELNDQKLELGDKDIIYISTDTPIDKSFFESLKYYDYKIKFPKTNAVIEISKNKTEEK